MAFEVAPANVDELAQGDPRELALENARRKALAVPGALVLGADTDVGRRHLEGDAQLLQDRPPLGRSGS